MLLLTVASLAPAQYPKSETDLQADLDRAQTKPQVQNALLALDRFYQRERDWARQAEILKRIVDFWSHEIAPNSIGVARFSADLGKALQRTHDYPGAEQSLRLAISLFDQNGDTYTSASIAAKRILIGTLRDEDKRQEADDLLASLPASTPAEKPDQHPKLISKVEPNYSDQARDHMVSGSIMLSLVVDQSGRPKDIGVIAPLGFGLDQNAIKAVQKWRFEPATINGSPVEARATVEVSFRLF